MYLYALPRVTALPGVQSAAFAIDSTIAFGGSTGPGGIKVEGHEVIDDLPDGGPFLYSGIEGFFETLGVTVTRGRSFELGDFADGAEPVAAITRPPHDVVLMDVQMPEMDGLEATGCRPADDDRGDAGRS